MTLSKLVLTVFLLSLHSVCAQSEVKPAGKNDLSVKPEDETPTLISVVALGPKPPRRYSKKNDGGPPAMLMARPGEIPPSRLYFKGKSATDKKADWQPFSVSFNNPSAMKSIAPEKTLTLYRKISGKDSSDDKYVKYISIPPGRAGGRRVFFFIPSTTGSKLWDKPPLIRTINLDAESLKGKQFVLKNLSQFTVLHAFADSVITLPPMKTISYTRPKSGELYRLAALRCSRTLVQREKVLEGLI